MPCSVFFRKFNVLVEMRGMEIKKCSGWDFVI
jgi:hypothetical protein